MSKKDKDELKDLEDKLDEEQNAPEEFSETWDNKTPGNTISGFITRKQFDIETELGTSDLIEVEKKDGTKNTVWMPKVLKSKVITLGLDIGDAIAIRALGKPKGKKYYNFVVVGRKREQQ
jgi:hypothetical protein